jgi:uncharacterized glyoxalase superfamily protein PhnB/uncharacterized protein YndB with AHSA1/START domain
MFSGQCEAAFKFYERVLGGRIVAMLPYTESPQCSGMAKDWQDKIMHARLQLGDRTLMASDAPPDRFQAPKGFYINIGVKDPAEAERIYEAMSVKGSVVMPIQETFWAQRFAMFVDQFGTPWMINCEKAGAAVDTSPFTLSRTFNAPREAVFGAFSDPERMRKWWGPKGSKVVSSKMDLRPGGTYHYGLRMPDGGTIWGKLSYREIVAPEKLVCVTSFSDERGGITRHPMSADWPLEMLTTLAFEEAGSGRTTLTVTWKPLNPTDKERAAFENGRASMNAGWSGTLDQLEGHLAETANSRR